MERTCQTSGCSNMIPPHQGRSRPRKFCVECRPPRNQPNPRVVKLAKPVEAPARAEQAEHPLVARFRCQLEAADRLDTPEGAVVMQLANLFAAGSHTASGAASLSRELRAAMEVALQGAQVEEDSLDELAARRAQKASNA